MALRFSSAELRRLSSAQRVLLSPLDYEDAREWGAEACRALRELVEMDRASFLQASADDPVVFTDLSDDVIGAYLEHYCTVDFATQRALRHELDIAHLWDVLPRKEFLASELFHDFSRPHRLFDAMMIRAGAEPSASAWIALQHGQFLDGEEITHRHALLEAVHPAFSTGVALWQRLAAWRTELARVLDALEEAIVVCDLNARVLHANPAFTSILAADPEGNNVQAALEALVRSASGLLGAATKSGTATPVQLGEQTIRTRHTEYRLRGNIVGRDLFRPGEALLVTLHPTLAERHPGELLGNRYGLSPQEARVARLLARGDSNAMIADELAISPHTVRRHTERVLRKLGVASRAQVAARLHLLENASELPE